jgi:molecular chaperone GrpE
MTTKKTSGRKKNQTGKQQSKINKLEEELKQVHQELEESKDKLLRSIADLQNQQKRMEKEFRYREEELKKRYLSELIDVAELLKKACEEKHPKEGLKLILHNIETFLHNEQISYIDCVGKSFDHNLHHAVTTLEKENCEDNIIVEELKKGYKMEEKVLRPSHVIVAKKKEKNKMEVN